MQNKPGPRVVKIENIEGYQRLIVPGKDSYKIKSGCVTLNAGESVGEHSTESKEEAIMILRGEAEITCEGEVFTAKEQTVIYMPPETKHDVRNSGQGILQYVFLVVPV